MNVKTLKRMSKRSVSVLLTVLMIISLFTVCMVGTTVTAGAAGDSIGGKTITLNASGWQSAHVFVGNSNKTFHYTMTGTNGEFTVKFPDDVSLNDATNYFFSTVNYGLDDGASNTVNISTVRTNLINGKYTCSGLVDKSVNDINDGNVYTVDENGTVTVSSSSSTPSSSGWINATMYNYRTASQITDAMNTDGTLTEEQNYAVDSKNGQAKEVFTESVYKQYNDAVAAWFQNQSTDGKVNGVSVTPLYQGNIRAGNDFTNEKGTVDWAKTYFNFVSVANGANRKDGASAASINAAAVGLADKTLSANGTIQQNGIELPQFSDAFMNANADSKIQSKYDNLKFETRVTKKASGNEWYSYDSSTDKNRSLDIANRQIKNYKNEVKGCKNANGDQNATAGYYPFNQSQPSKIENITNCFGTRFDIDYAMPNANGVVNNEEMQFNFTGDDDMWIYIDGHLVLDLGGSHAMASGSINLATMKVTYSTGYYNATYDNVADKNSASCAYHEAEEFAIGNDVKKILQDTTRTHKMTIFYMERGLFDSNLSFNFFLPQTNSLTVEQKTDTSAVNSALVNNTLQTADKDAFQTTIDSDSQSATSNKTASVTEDFTRKDADGNTQVLQKGSSSSTQTGTPFTNLSEGTFTSIGGTNFVWEDKNSTDTTKGKGTPTNGTVELLYNQSATFNDQFANGSKFKLTNQEALKSFNLPNLTENQPTSSENGRNRSDYYDTTLKVTDISGSELTPNEDNSYNFGDGSDNAVKINAEYTNKVKVGSVAFTKNIVNENSNADDYFTFKIQMRNIFGGTSDSEWKVYEGLNYTVSGITGVKTLGEEGTVQLKNGETLTIAGVPVGTEYRITETGSTSGTYSVSGVTQDTEVAQNSNMVSETNGFNAKLPTSGAGATASYTVNNTSEKVTVLYRYQDRAVETGLPTDLENHYTYFTRSVAGNISSIVDLTTGKLTEDGKKKLKASLPEVSNVLMSYSVNDENIEQNVEYTALTDEYLNKKLPLLTNKPDNPDHTAEGVPNDIKALVDTGKKVLVVTYNAVQKNYTVNLTFPQLQEDGTTYAVKTSSVSGHFNSLILNNTENGSDYTAPKSYTDADGKHTFKYWAKRVAIEGGASSNKKWVPVSTNYTYNYRITDNMELKAVYNTDEDYTQLDAPEVTDDNTITYMPTGTGTGYAAAASERIYDSYSKDNTDRTRVNVIFDAVGSANLDKKITKVGYVLIKNTGSYANASEFTEDVIKDAITSTTSKINGHDALIKYYDVVGRVDFNGDSYDQDGKTWTSEYQAGQVNLTNKNRANFVFDLKNTEASHNYYFTCYTVMQRDGHTYVSKSPSYFNLGEADPNVTPVTPTEDTYNISTSARYTTDSTTYISDTKAGNVSSNGVRVVTEGKTIKVSYYPTSYTADDIQYVSQLESLKIGKQTITSDDFALLGIDPTKSGSYQFTFSKEKYLGADAAAGATLEIVASFKAEANENYITVKAPAVTNGTVKIGNDYTAQNDVTLAVEKGGSFYVKATPADGYGFTNWSVNGASVSTANPVKVDVAENGSLSVNGTPVTMEQLTPVFEQMINVTLTSGTGGTISYSYNYNTVVSGTVPEGQTETVKVPAGTEITLTANPNSGYSFAKWGEDGAGFAPTSTIKTSQFSDATITAEFERVPNKTLYLKLGCNEWKAGNQRFVAVLKDPGAEPLVMTKVNDELYRVEVPSGTNYTKVIFCKMSNNNEQFDWNNKDYQTDNLTIPTDGKMMYTVTEQVGTQYATGEWSAAPDDNSVTVTAPTNVANGKVYIGTDDTTQTSTTLTFTKGTAASFYVKAEPNTGYAFKNWTVNGTTISDNPVMVSVSDTGALSVNGTAISSLNDLVPNFEGGTTGEKTTLYLVPNTWNKDGAKFAVRLKNPETYSQPEMWIPMEKVNDNLYKVDVPSQYDYKTVIFCRMNSNSTEYNEGNIWNKSSDQNFPTDNQTKFTVNEGQWDGDIGTWSTP